MKLKRKNRKVLEEKSIPLPLSPIEIPHLLAEN